MTVLVTLRVGGDPKKLEELAAGEDSPILKIRDRGVEFGCISHRFYATDDEILVVDEWPDEASFRGFFDASPDIKGVMDAAESRPSP